MRILLIVAAAVAAVLWLGGNRDGGWPLTNDPPGSGPVLALGDSLTAGSGASRGGDYPSLLAALIGEPVINAGVPGETTADVLKRLDAVLAERPRLALVTLGANDLRLGVDRVEAFANLAQIVSRLQQAGALVVIGGIDIPLLGRGFGDAYRELAEDSGSLLLPNVLDGILGEPDLMADSVHPNDAGYAIMAERFHQVISAHTAP